MAQNDTPRMTTPNTGSTFRSRLFHYSIGLAIGCVMTGAIISARYKAAQAQAAAREAEIRAAEAAAAQRAASGDAAAAAQQPAPAPSTP